jgi:hypothetical protein
MRPNGLSLEVSGAHSLGLNSNGSNFALDWPENKLFETVFNLPVQTASRSFSIFVSLVSLSERVSSALISPMLSMSKRRYSSRSHARSMRIPFHEYDTPL